MPSNVDKFDTAKVEYVKLFEVIFKKCDASFIHILLLFASRILQNEFKTLVEVSFICQKIVNAIQNVSPESKYNDFKFLRKNPSWVDFVKIATEASFKESKSRTEISTNLLRVLATVCEAIYEDETNKNQAKTIFEMVTSHTEYRKIMLDNSPFKGMAK